MNHRAKLLELSRSIQGLNRVCSNEMLKGEGIHFGQPPIFHALLDQDNQSQCDIAASIGVSRASVGVSLRRMETVVRIRSQKPHETPATGSFGRPVRQNRRFRQRVHFL